LILAILVGFISSNYVKKKGRFSGAAKIGDKQRLSSNAQNEGRQTRDEGLAEWVESET
jgi:hypothetical protein